MTSFGFRCFHCSHTLNISSHGLCSHCIKQLHKQPYCQQCGSPLPHFHTHCGHCLQDEPKWQRIMQVSSYKPPLSEWIHRFKFRRHYWLDHALARLLLLEIKQQQRERYIALPEVIIPVPLFWKRQWQRGYNQAECLARPLAKWLNLPLDTESLRRIRHTTAQRELTAAARRRNLKSAFCYHPPKTYKRVALVDDVVTTGSTLNAICAELRKQGVEEIIVWTLART